MENLLSLIWLISGLFNLSIEVKKRNFSENSILDIFMLTQTFVFVFGFIGLLYTIDSNLNTEKITDAKPVTIE
jgi:hypothetical protein